MKHRLAIAGMVALGVAALPATASAHRYSAYAGTPVAKLKGLPEAAQLNTFFPAKMKVHAGDKVRYTIGPFPHTVSVLAKGTTRPALAGPVTDGSTYQNVLDPQGKPFFFNGLGKFQYNPLVFQPQGSRTVGDGKLHGSGFMIGAPKPVDYTLKFAKPGSYTVLCLLHPGMQQRVTVLKKRAKGAAGDARVKAAITKQAVKLVKAAKSALKGVPDEPNTVYAGVESKQASIIAFLPGTLNVAAGTTVTFEVGSPSEVHNEVFGPTGPGSFVDAFTSAQDLIPAGPGATANQFAPTFVYGSEPPGPSGAFTYTGSNYGIGFMWTPLMDDQPGNPPMGLPGSQKVTFTTPGTYTYYCAIHGSSMSGKIVVQ
jgi:plastocyanin